jgi:hypothetical protein
MRDPLSLHCLPRYRDGKMGWDQLADLAERPHSGLIEWKGKKSQRRLAG